MRDEIVNYYENLRSGLAKAAPFKNAEIVMVFKHQVVIYCAIFPMPVETEQTLEVCAKAFFGPLFIDLVHEKESRLCTIHVHAMTSLIFSSGMSKKHIVYPPEDTLRGITVYNKSKGGDLIIDNVKLYFVYSCQNVELLIINHQGPKRSLIIDIDAEKENVYHILHKVEGLHARILVNGQNLSVYGTSIASGKQFEVKGWRGVIGDVSAKEGFGVTVDCFTIPKAK